MINDLYPIPVDEAATKFIFGRAKPARDQTGAMLLPDLLTAAEREIVHGRLKQIAAAVAPARKGEIAKAMLAIFPDLDREIAKARAKTLADAMEGLPLFAIKRAGLKLSQAGVSNPDRATLRIEAEAVARPHWNEASIGSMLLNAKRAPQEISAEERERVAARVGSFAAEQAAVYEAAEAERREAFARSEMLDSNIRRANEYRRYGFDPIFADPEKTMVVSLSLLVSLGWRIEEIGHETVLLRPTGDRYRAGERTDG